MVLDDAPLLHEPDLMLAVLRVAAAGSGTLDDCLEHLRQLRRIAQVDEPMPEAEVRVQLEEARAKLQRARLIEAGTAGRCRITARGRRILADNPGGIDDTVLMAPAAPRPINGHHRARSSSKRPASIDYQSGYGAYLAGAKLAENPHAPDARAYLDWENGWSQARDDKAIR
jgi:ribosome modulation factor